MQKKSQFEVLNKMANFEIVRFNSQVNNLIKQFQFTIW